MVKAHVSTPVLVAGRYRLVEVVHQETNRVCWYAEDGQAQRPCLVTQIGLPDDAGGEAARRVTAQVLRTSERMSLMLAKRVAEVVDAVEESGALWLVTRWIDGQPLGELLAQQGTLNYVRAARIGLEVLDVLEAAHGQGISHGELSPSQVFVRDQGPVVVSGFGLAGATRAPRLAAPAFASPEQARDERIGPATDLWALGALLYTMVEGRPPFRDRGRPEATLKAVDRLPLRTPVRAGPLTQAVQGLLRKDPVERLPRPVVREALLRVLDEETAAAMPSPRLRGRYVNCSSWSNRTMVAGTALAVVTVAVAVLAVTDRLPGGSDSPAAGTPPRPTPSATASPAPSPSPSDPVAPAPTESPYSRYASTLGFSVSLPEGWRPLRTNRISDLAYRVVLGAEGDARTLTVTYSERVGPDPVDVWREVEPGLKQGGGYRRIGDIRATTYRGQEAAEMEWLANDGGTRVRTLGRGYLIGDNRGYSLRWTAPAADWDDAANREALATALRTFKEPSD
ncbi:serine/threonine protein kinase [Streptomyces davaonensis JCM 4913]|uniref:non-specific serine/threonine protein kinase n=1 Tax=Streptomyces davaonensis (strain DSM 101723 / JCM 4913 / KCC S-0913 / 768) TaxID=1214101 RepID=K4RGY1_STRDJ|nr:serine/threonine protein kinase [Streptomyces davaonensis JCM 4913]